MLINKETLEYLADLGKLQIKNGDEEKLLRDLEEILTYFEELKEVDTENIEPLAGGTIDINVFREDEAPSSRFQAPSPKLTDSFPEEERGFLKIPPVFE